MSAPARVPAPPDLRQRHGVETPEHVELQFELAGLGSRAAAAILDLFLLVLGSLLVAAVGSALDLDTALGSWFGAFLILLYSFSFFLYYTVFEGLGNGRTPGKRALGIRAVLDTGRPITFSAAAVRNIVRLVDFGVPAGPIVGLLCCFLNTSNKRLGDMAAGTIVVRDRPTEWNLGAATTPEAEPDVVEVGPPELTDDEFRLLDRFLERLPDLAPTVAVRMTVELAHRFETRVPRRTTDPQAYLVELLAEEQLKRRSRFATRARPGAAGAMGRTTVTGERFVARKRAAWEAFRAQATRLERLGVGTLPAAEIPEFAARYREVAADLARGRTYGVDPRVIAYLERLVSAGHNALYRSRSQRRAPLGRYLLADFPAAVVQSWRYVVVAFVLFMVPGLVGYTMLRERPELADDVMPAVMVNRAEQAADRQANGEGYAQSPDEELPVIASAIISNNIRVCLMAFSGGILLGALTIWSLIVNGLMLGMGLGLFVNYHAGWYLGTFVAGHGVLELTAIFISGGAGLRLAHALLAPGDRTRRDALVVDGAIAVRTIGAVIVLLVLAGSIEGLLSASDAPAVFKFAASGISAVFLALYFSSGRRALSSPNPSDRPSRAT